MSSQFAVEIVPVKLEPHENADSLSIVSVWGYKVVVRSADWADRTIGAYIPPDSVVPDTEEFAWLGGHRRIKARKLRGVWSQGLLIQAPEGAQVGDDVADLLGIIHYEPPLKLFHGHSVESDAEAPPPGLHPGKYDVEHLRRYTEVFNPGEYVVATEKIHGANSRFTYRDGRFWAGSRNQWVKQSEGSVYWRALERTPALKTFLIDHPAMTVYGEVYGWVQDLRYGHKPGEVSFAAFDIWRDSIEVRPGEFKEPGWLDVGLTRNLLDSYGVPQVPLLFKGAFSMERMEELAEGMSEIPGANHIREGCVVRPVFERQDPVLGRVQLKLVSNNFLEKAA